MTCSGGGTQLRLSVLINTLRRSEMLAEALASLASCDPSPYELVIIDGDPDRSAEPVARAFAECRPGIRLRYETSPPGMAVQRNRALRSATGDIVLVTDDDVTFDPRALGALLRAYCDPEVVGATGRVLQTYNRFGAERSLSRRLVAGRREGTMTSFGYPRRIQTVTREHDVEFMQGCMMSARREIALAVAFDEQLGTYGAEDEDFSYRLSKLGRIRYLPDAMIHHKTIGFASIDRRHFSRVVATQRAYLFRKNFRQTPATRAKFAGFMVVMAGYRFVNRDWRGLLGFVEGCIAAWRDPRVVPHQRWRQ